jgi:hypothetical protein
MPPRKGNGRFLKTAQSAERDAEALRMKTRGMTLQAISDALGYGGHANVSTALDRAVAAIVGPDAQVYYQIQMTQLDDLTARVYKVLDGDHPLVSEGQIVRDNGVPLSDPSVTLAAVDRMLRLMERRAKLMGLDGAVKHDLTVHHETEQDRELAELLREAQAANAVAEARLSDR